MTAIEDAAERAVAAVILFGDLDTAADVRNAAKMIARNVCAEVEPLIREDERARMAYLARVVPGGGIRDVRGEVLADLRAQVMTLPELDHEARVAVLVLIDGSSE